MAEKKPARDVSGLNPDVAKSLVNTSEENRLVANQGTFGSNLLEPVPHFIKTDSEKEICNKNNASIILGRDRPANIMSGYGGRGDTQAASIDIVVGRMGPKPKSDLYVDPDLKVDAARIYISQKTDVDANFGCAPGLMGSPDYFEKPASAVAVKADGVRVLARDGGIKLITGIDNINSQGGEVMSRTGIELIAGNDSRDMQPLVKGNNLIKCIEQIYDTIADLTGVVSGLSTAVAVLTAAVGAHYHVDVPPTPVSAGVSLPDPVLATVATTVATNLAARTQTNLVFSEINQPMSKFNYLNPVGKFYINSENNLTN
tara:strand:- start:1460 stop:2404 length:945 start_codon:yes stop_codon:yes gene_type:complete